MSVCSSTCDLVALKAKIPGLGGSRGVQRCFQVPRNKDHCVAAAAHLFIFVFFLVP